MNYESAPYYQSCYTSKLLLDKDVTLLVMTTVRLMWGSATESRLLPVTVTSVPPLSMSTDRKPYALTTI